MRLASQIAVAQWNGPGNVPGVVINHAKSGCRHCRAHPRNLASSYPKTRKMQ
ncbi:hypothetical protein [Devosia sp. DBB001]|nr:hypothetical protein [Devosia sp. DBB001]